MRHTVGMLSLHFRQSRTLSAVSLMITAGIALTACSSSSSPPPKSSTTKASAPASSAPPSSGEPTTGSGATSAIEANWATFFNAKTPNSRRIGLLEDGQEFTAIIKAQSTSTLARAATSKATAVSLTGTDQAAVTYTILIAGKPVLSGQHGVAVYQDGVWKVGLVSFCGLLKEEGTKGLPAACSG
jgi:hypothetical protein